MPAGMDIRHYSELLDALYRGPFEAQPFCTFLDELRRILGLSFAALILRHPESLDHGMIFMSSPKQPRTSVDAPPNIYNDHYYAFDPLTNLPFDQVVTLDEVTSMAELEKTEFYHYCMAQDDIHHIAGLDLRDDRGHRFSLRLARPRSMHNFDAGEREFIGMLASHVRRAVANSIALVQLDSEREFYARAISGRSLGVVVLNEQGRLLRSNATADRILAERDGISLLHRQLHLRSGELNDMLRAHVQAALEALRQGRVNPIQAISVPRPSGKPDYELVLNTVPVDRYLTPEDSPHLIVFISDPAAQMEISTQTLMRLYNLTAAQATLVIRLAEGKSLEEAAAAQGIKTSTARAHLRAIFAKTGTTQQSKLVSLVLKSLAAVLHEAL